MQQVESQRPTRSSNIPTEMDTQTQEECQKQTKKDSVEKLVQDTIKFSEVYSWMAKDDLLGLLLEKCIQDPSNKRNVSKEQLQGKDPVRRKIKVISVICILSVVSFTAAISFAADLNMVLIKAVKFGVISNTTQAYLQQNFLYEYCDRPFRILSNALNLQLESMVTDDLYPVCVVNNPFRQYENLSDTTCYCTDATDIMSFEDLQGYYGETKKILSLLERDHVPAIIKDRGRKITEFDLEEQLTRYGMYFGDSQYFSSKNPNITSLRDLSAPDVLHQVLRDSQTHIIWSGAHFMRVSVIERLFPLGLDTFNGGSYSYFFAARTLLLDGNYSVPYTIPREVLGMGKAHMVLYMQGWGSRAVRLIPKQRCEESCAVLETQVLQGDLCE